MILHEYQGTQLVNKYHVPIPLGQVAFNEKEAFAVARKFGADYNRKFVVKAQVQCFGRTKGYFKENGFKGGIHVVDNIEQVRTIAGKMLGKTYINDNVSPQGIKCNCVYIMEELDVGMELIIGISHDKVR